MLDKPYSLGPYNKFDDKEQWIRITEGCPHNCPFCYEPQEMKVFEIPEIVRNDVKIIDMNLLAHPEALEIIRELGKKRVNGKVVYYHLVCGIDYRFLTPEIAKALKEARFVDISIAWDWAYTDQYRLKDAIKMLLDAGYRPENITVFMICNWKVSFEENILKLDLCKVWNVKAADCYYDNQVSPNIKPIHWTREEIRAFRRIVRKHNQLVNFKADPEITPSNSVQTRLEIQQREGVLS